MMIKNITRVFVICLTAALIESSASKLPPECNHYTILDDRTRNVNHGYWNYCDNVDVDAVTDTSPDWQGT